MSTASFSKNPTMSPTFPMSHAPYMDKRRSVQQNQTTTTSTTNHSQSLLNGSTLASHAESESIELSRQNTNPMTISSNLYIEPEYNMKLVLNFNANEIKLIRSTWNEMINDDLNKNLNTENNAQATSINHASIASSLFCIQFYSNLLGMDPNLERMFPSIKHQAISFAGVLSTAIINLENLKALDDFLLNLGKRHSRILGIDPPHFELMGVALLKTFQDRFGINFSLELERCWARLYTYLANSILQFGIDPVLKIDKINNEWEQVHNGSSGNSSPHLERTMTELTSSSTFDTRSINTNSTLNQNTKLRQPSGVSSMGTSLKQQSAVSSLGHGTAKLGKKVMNGKSKSSSGSSGSEEEKCVIM